MLLGQEYEMGKSQFKIYTTQASNCTIPSNFIDVDYSVPPSGSGGRVSDSVTRCHLLPVLFALIYSLF